MVVSVRVYVHIDAVALRGFSAAQRDQILTGLRAELAQLLIADPASIAPRSLASVNGGRIPWDADASAVSIGRAAAQRIAGSVRT